MRYKIDKNHWRWGLRQWEQEQWQRGKAREQLDRVLNRFDERKPTPEEAAELLTLALDGFPEKTLERKLVVVLSKFVAQ